MNVNGQAVVNGGGSVDGGGVVNGNAAAGESLPDAPTSLVATPVSTSQIDLGWADNGTTDDGYKVYRSTDGISYSEIDDIAPDSTSYNDATVAAGATYWYKVAAYNGVGEAESNVATANTLTLSMISFWELEEASGNRADSHGSNTLTDNNTVTQQVGKVGNAAEFAIANSEYLSRANNVSLQTGDIDFSVGFWVYVAALSTQIIVAKYAVGQFEYRFDVTATRFRLLVSNDGASLVTVTANNFGLPVVSTWYWIMGWHDSAGNTINISVNNGAPDTTAHATGVFGGTAPFSIGASGVPATFFGGRVDQAIFSKRLWVANEKASLYNGGNGRAYSYINP